VETSPPVFGVNMALVAPGASFASWLLYKLLLSPPGPPSGSREGAPDDAGGNVSEGNGSGDAPAPWTDEDRQALGETVPGAPMPKGSAGLATADLERLRRWIDEGATVTPCEPNRGDGVSPQRR
jgi:hypothetical protein